MLLDTIKWFKDLSGLEENTVGRKATRIAQINKSKVQVPRGFVITNKEYFDFLQKNNLKTKIANIIKEINFDDPIDIQNKSDLIKHKIYRSKISDELTSKIAKAYSKIGEKKIGWLNTKNDVYAAVRCSVVCESACPTDIKKIEDEGGNLNIKGLNLLIANVKDCWASLFSKDSLLLIKKKGYDLNKLSIAVIVQQMINAKKSGILFTSKDLNTPDVCYIEAIWGIGGRLVLKQLTPDHYEVKKKIFEIVEKNYNDQNWQLVRNKGKTIKKELKIEEHKLDKLDIKDLITVAKKIENYFGTPQIVEWAIDKKDIYILNTEPINYQLEENRKKKQMESQQKISAYKHKLLLKGVPVSKGASKGIVTIIKSPEDYAKVNNNSIIVTNMTNNSMLDIIKESKGVITKEGSAICHAAVVCQKFGVPAIVNVKTILEEAKDGQRIQINGTNGEIHSVEGAKIIINNSGYNPKEEMKRVRQKILGNEENKDNKDNKDNENNTNQINTNTNININTNKNLDIRNIEQIDINNIKNIEFPINYIFTEDEIVEYSKLTKKEIITKIREKISKIIKNI